MNFKLLGSVLLIVGTCIGAGMLALPIATAELGWPGSVIMLFVCWFVMTAGAYLLLEVNLWMPLNSNLNTMARATLGAPGQFLSWICILFLLYSVLCAYIAGGSGLFYHLLMASGLTLARWQTTILFILIFGGIVWLGVRSIDYVNRGLMLLKFSGLFLLVFLLLPFITPEKLLAGDLHHLTSYTALMVTITSFGFAVIIPSVRIYLGNDVPGLKLAILLGSLIPLICYIAWDGVIMGVVPLDRLALLLKSQNATSDLALTLSQAASNPIITFFMRLFTSVCVLTSFLGVSLTLTDFWADALQIEKKGLGNLGICALTFLPPVITVLFFPGLFVRALEYAGMDCIVLLVLLPVWMVWAGRYHRLLGKGYRVPGGKFLLIALTLFSLLLLIHPA